METPSIRSISWQTPKAVLGGEATHFTPWLAENLHLLAAALDIEALELEGTEHDISGKKLDVLAAVGREIDGDTIGVAIENQYGLSEHGHLGQLLTYMAGVSATYDRVLGVWLVDQAHPAHEAAIELLNRETNERLGFVLARARFIALGPTEFGVDFDVLAQPNEFIKQQPRKTVNAARHTFLEQLAVAISEDARDMGFTKIRGPYGGYSFHVLQPGQPWFIDIRVRAPQAGLRALLYINGLGDRKANEELLEQFLNHHETIEGELHYEHDFEPRDHLNHAAAKVAAISTCQWPGWGYQSPLEGAATRVLEFLRGVMSAHRALAV